MPAETLELLENLKDNEMLNDYILFKRGLEFCNNAEIYISAIEYKKEQLTYFKHILNAYFKKIKNDEELKLKIKN